MSNDFTLSHLRQDYKLASFGRADAAPEPFTQFRQWFAETQKAEIVEPNAMILATATVDGRPSSRTVLLKQLDHQGFTFFTNYASQKGRELAENPHASLTFLWKELERQVHIRGAVEKVTAEESDAYFAQRPYKSQIGAVASAQSEVIADRQWLEERFAALARMYPEGSVPRPPSWGGYRVLPHEVEFWQGRQSRLHDRLRYSLVDGAWRLVRLSP